MLKPLTGARIRYLYAKSEGPIHFARLLEKELGVNHEVWRNSKKNNGTDQRLGANVNLRVERGDGQGQNVYLSSLVTHAQADEDDAKEAVCDPLHRQGGVSESVPTSSVCTGGQERRTEAEGG